MLQIDTLLPLYPDDASRYAMLEQALTCVRSDLAALRQTIGASDYEAALQHVHRAKGTASFLGGNSQSLQLFDDFTQALKQAIATRRTRHADHTGGARSDSTATDIRFTEDTHLTSAYRAVESTLHTLESALQLRINHHPQS